MNCVRDMVISSEFCNIISYTRLISCLNVRSLFFEGINFSCLGQNAKFVSSNTKHRIYVHCIYK